MRGAFFVVVLIAMLIAGILVIRDMNTEVDDGVQRKEAVEKAEQAVQQAEAASKQIIDQAKKVHIPPTGQGSPE